MPYPGFASVDENYDGMYEEVKETSAEDKSEIEGFENCLLYPCNQPHDEKGKSAESGKAGFLDGIRQWVGGKGQEEESR